MKRYAFEGAKFIKSAIVPSGYPKSEDSRGRSIPEIAVAGRSNVGKSSLLNHLFRRKGLVKTSSVPGKTRLLNFFSVDDALGIVDLPGYGYAKVPRSEAEAWDKMLAHYMEKRAELKVMLLLLDIRRTPNKEDKQLIEWVAHHQKSLIIVLTKADKLKASQRAKQAKKIMECFDVENLHFLLYSTTKNIGRRELIHMVNEALRDELEPEETQDGITQ